MTKSNPLAIVAGAGAGLGQALLRRFEEGGMDVVGLGRSRPETTHGAFRDVDLTDVNATSLALNEVIRRHGPPEIVVHNTSELVIAPFAKTQVEDFQRTWASMVQSLVVMSQVVVPPMIRAGGGTIIVSGATASVRGGAKFSAFASAKFALRGLTQSLAREFQPAGIHVAHVILDGIIDTAESRERHSLDASKMMQTADIAEAYWQLAQQPKSTWTHELDLRPASETF